MTKTLSIPRGVILLFTFLSTSIWCRPIWSQVKGPIDDSRITADFDGSGSVDGSDLTDLLPKEGSRLGEPDYGFRFDLDLDEVIDPDDIALFADQWLESGRTPSPFPVNDVRQAMGFNNPPGTTWSFSCMEGSTENCTGEERTLALGNIRTAFGQAAVPFVWGSGAGEPWAEILLSATGPLSILGVDKVGGPEGLPGFQIPADMAVELAGPILWSTSEMVHPGRTIRNEGTGTLFATPTIKGWRGKGMGIHGICLLLCRILMDPPDKDDRKTLLEGSFILNGEGEFDYGMGKAQADWDIVARDGRVRTLRMCWKHGDERKCIAFGEIQGGGDCVVETEDFPDTGGGAIPTFDFGACIEGSLSNFEDAGDFVLFANPGPEPKTLRVTANAGEFDFLGIRVYLESPIEPVRTGAFTSDGTEFLIDIPNGQSVYVEVYQLDGIGEYEVRAETVITK